MFSKSGQAGRRAATASQPVYLPSPVGCAGGAHGHPDDALDSDGPDDRPASSWPTACRHHSVVFSTGFIEQRSEHEEEEALLARNALSALLLPIFLMLLILVSKKENSICSSTTTVRKKNYDVIVFKFKGL